MNMFRMTPWVVAALAAAALSCNEIARDPSPIELVATTQQDITIVDLAGGPGCDQNLGTIVLRSIQKNTSSPSTFLGVELNRMHVSYRRTDGGSMAPESFTQTIDGFIEPGGQGTLNNFIVFRQDALRQAPFAALLPVNGGRDPETGLSLVRMDVLLRIFGETLSGQRVAADTRFPLEFCYNCGGCR
jgi:hypothetical protein